MFQRLKPQKKTANVRLMRADNHRIEIPAKHAASKNTPQVKVHLSQGQGHAIFRVGGVKLILNSRVPKVLSRSAVFYQSFS